MYHRCVEPPPKKNIIIHHVAVNSCFKASLVFSAESVCWHKISRGIEGVTLLRFWQPLFQVNMSHKQHPYGGFLKWWYPTTMGFPTKNDHFGVFWGYHHLRKHLYDIFSNLRASSAPHTFGSVFGKREELLGASANRCGSHAEASWNRTWFSLTYNQIQ